MFAFLVEHPLLEHYSRNLYFVLLSNQTFVKHTQLRHSLVTRSECNEFQIVVIAVSGSHRIQIMHSHFDNTRRKYYTLHYTPFTRQHTYTHTQKPIETLTTCLFLPSARRIRQLPSQRKQTQWVQIYYSIIMIRCSNVRRAMMTTTTPVFPTSTTFRRWWWANTSNDRIVGVHSIDGGIASSVDTFCRILRRNGNTRAKSNGSCVCVCVLLTCRELCMETILLAQHLNLTKLLRKRWH